jgi:hypothetical protein
VSRMAKMAVAVILCMRVSAAQTSGTRPRDKEPTATCEPSLLILPGGILATKSCDGTFKVLNPPTPTAPPSVSPAPTAGLSPNVLLEQEKYVIWSFQQSRRLYEWQHRSSVAIFVVVIMLVVSGIYFAALQFHYSLGAKVGSGARKTETTEIDASLKGVKVKSSLLGVIVLAISMAFLYLYVVRVYPIVDLTPKESTQFPRTQ